MKLGKGSGRAREVLGRGHLEHRQLRQERGHEVHEQAPPARRVPLPPPLQRLQKKYRKKCQQPPAIYGDKNESTRTWADSGGGVDSDAVR